MKIDLPISASGRYKIVKHNGEESPWSDNLFLYGGRAFMLHDGANTITCSVDGYSHAPDYDGPYDGLSPMRSSTALVSATTTRNITADAQGRLIWRTTWRFNFPATAGLGTATYKRGGIGISSDTPVWVPLGGGVIPYAGARASTAMLQTPFGDDGRFTVDQETESFDVVWEFTEYVRAESTGSITVRKMKSGTLLSESLHGYTVRAANFDNTADNTRGWMPISTRDFPAMRSIGVTVGEGTISDSSNEPTFTKTHSVSSFAVAPVTMTRATNSNSATVKLPLWESANIDTIHLRLGHFDFQVALDPPIAKSAVEEMTFTFNVAVN